MSIVLLIARLFLSAIFVVSGVAKLVDLDGARRALKDFGVPERYVGLLGLGLPVVEVLIAILLLPLNSAWWGALVALVVLSIFSIGIAIKIANGESPDCHCFGQIHSEPVGWPTLFRNMVFASAAVIVVILGKNDPGLSAFFWLSRLTPGEIVNLVASLSIIGLLIALLVILNRMFKRQIGLLETVERLKAALIEDQDILPAGFKEAMLPQEGLPIGAAAPGFELPVYTGGRISFNELVDRGKPLLLLFVSPSCSGCKTLIPVTRLWQREYTDKLSVAVVTKGSIEDTQTDMSRYDIDQLLIDDKFKVSDAYQAQWTPAAVLINPNGKIGSHLVYGDTAIREFFRSLTGSSDSSRGGAGTVPQISLQYPARKIGESLPAFALPDLNERIVSSDEMLGSRVALVFWDPSCTHCGSLVDDLTGWEEDPPPGAPRLFFVSSGDREASLKFNRRFKSTTLLDPDFNVGPLFGARSTPSAILIDDAGNIASSLAVGTVNVRALIGIPNS